jgi:hypothetical protein
MLLALIMTLLIGITLFLVPAGTPSHAAQSRCFPETGYCIEGRIRTFWEQQGGLRVFGYPIGPQHIARIEGRALQVQWFERYRLELHPEHAAPYDVLLGRMGAEVLHERGTQYQAFADEEPQPGCRFFAPTGHNVCGEIRAAWERYGLEVDGQDGISEADSLALFGYPVSPLYPETLGDGQTYLVQWFERARFELHPENDPPYHVLFGLLGAELHDDAVPAQARTTRTRTRTPSPSATATFTPTSTATATTRANDDDDDDDDDDGDDDDDDGGRRDPVAPLLTAMPNTPTVTLTPSPTDTLPPLTIAAGRNAATPTFTAIPTSTNITPTQAPPAAPLAPTTDATPSATVTASASGTPPPGDAAASVTPSGTATPPNIPTTTPGTPSATSTATLGPVPVPVQTAQAPPEPTSTRSATPTAHPTPSVGAAPTSTPPRPPPPASPTAAPRTALPVP